MLNHYDLWLTRSLGRHLHSPSQRHMDALKPIYRFCQQERKMGPCITRKDRLDLRAILTVTMRLVRILENRYLVI